MFRDIFLCVFFAAIVSLCPFIRADEPKKDEPKPKIEVCFVLDTTGSMSGLIEGAKQKIWAIANEMISAKPTPEIRVGVIGYRDRGDEYVIKSFDLTNDIDAVYANLRGFKADGGGDTRPAAATRGQRLRRDGVRRARRTARGG